jgi:signal transduction histidine kinase
MSESNPKGWSRSQTVALSPDEGRLELARVSLAGGKPLRAVLRDVLSVASSVLGVERVGIWLFSGDRSSIHCDILHQAVRTSVSEGAILHAADYPGYFLALEQKRVVPVGRVTDDSLYREFEEAYFRPLGITSMVDAPIYGQGKVTGIVCHEHVGDAREWTRAECDFAAAVAETIARLYQEAARARAEDSLDGVRERLAALERMGDLGRLAAGIAHDFRNVLGAAGGYAELLESSGRLDPENLEHVRGLKTALEQGIRLTRELTDFGQPEAIRPRVLDLATAIAGNRSILQIAVGASIDLRFEISAVTGSVFIDSHQFERILLNLVLNARDAMPRGGILDVVLRQEIRGGSDGLETDYAVLELRDTGVGIPQEIRSRIFDPFFTTKGEQGTGLGLAIVNQIVTHAGGFIEVESEPGQGTTIRLLLPEIGRSRP